MSAQPTTGPVATIDLGSGAAKLLVVDGDRSGVERPPLLRHAIKTNLLADGDRPTASGLASVGDALGQFAELLAPHQPTSVSVIATAWARGLDDITPVSSLVEQHLGVPLEVLSGQREAELAYRGATAGREIDGPVVIIDVGAGSTEFAVGNGGSFQAGLSLDVGGRSLCRQYLESDPPTPAELSSALSVVELYIDDVRRELPQYVEALGDGATVIGLGAVHVIAEVEIGLEDPDAESVDGYVMEKAAVEEVFRALATESAEDRAHNPGLRPADVDDVVGAMCLAVEFMRQLSVDEIVVSERGLNTGLVAELLDGTGSKIGS